MTYKALISGHIYKTRPIGNDIEILTYVDNDVEDTEIFSEVEYELLCELEHHLKHKRDYYFMAIVYARWTSRQSQEGTEYDVEYDIHEIKDIADLDKEASF